MKASANRLERTISCLAAASIASIAISISVSHGFIILCFLLYPFYLYFEHRKKPNRGRSSLGKKAAALTLLKKLRPGLSLFLKQIPKPLAFGLYFYSFIFFYQLIHALKEGQLLDSSFGALWSDVFLLLFALIVWKLVSTGRPQNIRTLYTGLFVFVGFMLFTGALGALGFNEFFFSLLGKSLDKRWLFQWQGLDLYRNSGFMRVLLTYAGLLMLPVPFLLGSMFYLFCKARRYAAACLLLLLNCCTLFLLWLNGTRSVLAALLLSAPIIFYFVVRDFFIGEKARAMRPAFSKLVFFIFMLAAVTLTNTFLRSNQEKAKALGRPYERSVNFRSLIWTQGGQMLWENPVLGVGPGNYRKSALEQWELYYKETQKPSQKNPIPTGHAHSDVLHFAAVGGFPTALFFLFLAYASIRFALEKKSSWQSAYLSYGCICFFIAGLAQCYFLDAEVVFLFWTLTAMAAVSPEGAPSQESGGIKQI